MFFFIFYFKEAKEQKRQRIQKERERQKQNDIYSGALSVDLSTANIRHVSNFKDSKNKLKLL